MAGYVLKQRLAKRSNYGSKRSLSSIDYIVIHYTANDGDTDENNGNYFANNTIEASAHYFVDDDSVTQSVPDDYVAWSVGGSKYASCSSTGGGSCYGKATNANTLNIELCDDIANGVIYPSAKTIANALELTKAKMKEYGIPKERVIRHFDVTGKVCPGYWSGTAEKNAKWKTEFWNKLDDVTVGESISKPVASKPTTVAKPTTSDNKTLLVKVLASCLNVRADAGVGNKIVGTIEDGGIYTIVATKKVGNVTWGFLKSGMGWISLEYVDIVAGTLSVISNVTKEESFLVRVTADCLNIRSGAGVSNKVVGTIEDGGVYTIVKTQKVGDSTWGYLKSEAGWICLDYAKRV